MSEKAVRARVGVDFTEGNIYRHLIMFGLPMLLSNFLQQLYNAVDTMVIGKFEGTIGTVGVGSGRHGPCGIQRSGGIETHDICNRFLTVSK